MHESDSKYLVIITLNKGFVKHKNAQGPFSRSINFGCHETYKMRHRMKEQ